MKRLLILLFLFTVIGDAFAFSVSGHISGGSGFALRHCIAIPAAFDTYYVATPVPILNNYSFSNIPAGSYFLMAFQDVNSNLQPDISEPRGVYGGTFAQFLNVNQNLSGIGVSIGFPTAGGFQGSVAYSGAQTGPTIIGAFNNPNFTGDILGGGFMLNTNGIGSYFAFLTGPGTYYVYGMMDLNTTYRWEPGEPIGHYGGAIPSPLVITSSNYPTDVNLVLTDIPPMLPAVSNVSASDNLCESVEINWSSMISADSFEIRRNDLRLSGVAGNQTHYSDPSAEVGITYTYNVLAYNRYGAGDASGSDAGFRKSRPAVVSNVLATDDLCNSVVITWTDVADADSFQIRRNGTRIGVSSAHVTNFSDIPPQGWLNYTYRVVACNACGFGDSTGTNPGQMRSVPVAATGFTAEFLGYDSILVHWIDVANELGYQIFRNGTGIGSVGAGQTSFMDHPDPGFYIYKVVAFNACGNGVFSIADTAGYAPAPLTVVSPNGGEFFIQDSTQAVQWTGGNPHANVWIELSRNGTDGPWETLLASTPNDGAHSFVATEPISETCRIRVSSVVNPLESDLSNADFTITRMQTDFSETFESGATGWSSSSAAGWRNNWHLSIARFNSPSHSFKCGDPGTGNYSDSCDARLLSPVLSNLPARSTLRFYYQMDSEISSVYPDSAYDGGILEIAVHGAEFTQISPLGGYPKQFRLLAGGTNPATGPMRGKRCWAGAVSTWTPVVVDLAPYAGQDIQLRWRFGSDRATNREGWYVDDVTVASPMQVNPALTVPRNLILHRVNGELRLHWDRDGNYGYHIYSSRNPENPMENSVGFTRDNEFLIPGGATEPILFFTVVGWNGQ